MIGGEKVKRGVEAVGGAVARGAEATKDAVVGGVKATGRAIRTGAEAGAALVAYSATKTAEGGVALYNMGKEGVEKTIDAFEKGRDAVTAKYHETVDATKNAYHDTRVKFLNSVVDGPKYFFEQKNLDFQRAIARRLQQGIEGGEAAQERIRDKVMARCEERDIPSPAYLGERSGVEDVEENELSLATA